MESWKNLGRLRLRWIREAKKKSNWRKIEIKVSSLYWRNQSIHARSGVKMNRYRCERTEIYWWAWNDGVICLFSFLNDEKHMELKCFFNVNARKEVDDHLMKTIFKWNKKLQFKSDGETFKIRLENISADLLIQIVVPDNIPRKVKPLVKMKKIPRMCWDS
ncbi:MAG: hypothetical protein Ta2E_09620 [Mycoplasmoidaceae bacterium]|nr:MAG: hypothetical protein Ta2E_09620 [Mycoplasmoidaceae bacterium]